MNSSIPIAHPHSGLDGKTPEEFLALYETTRPSQLSLAQNYALRGFCVHHRILNISPAISTMALIVAVVLFMGSPAFGAPAPQQGSSGFVPGPGPCTTPPSLWASDNDYYGAVIGFGGANMAPICVVGLAPGTPPGIPPTPPGAFLGGSGGLATDSSGTLYVTDGGHTRIVKYTKTGAVITAFNTSLAATAVCVSPKTFIGVTREWNAGGGGDVEIFDQSGTLIGSATASDLASANYCAFDGAGNLFVVGNDSSGTSFIWYLYHQQLHTLGGALGLSNVGGGGWQGIYSRINPTHTLSAASVPYSGPGCSYCVSVKTWSISGVYPGALTLTLQYTCTITGYPGLQAPTVRQIAPSASGDLYIADWLNSKIEHTAPCVSSGSLASSTTSPAVIPPPLGFTSAAIPGYSSVPAPSQLYWGVATYPPGQY